MKSSREFYKVILLSFIRSVNPLVVSSNLTSGDFLISEVLVLGFSNEANSIVLVTPDQMFLTDESCIKNRRGEKG